MKNITKVTNSIIEIIRTGECPYLPFLTPVTEIGCSEHDLKFYESFNDFIYYKGVRYSIFENVIQEYNLDFHNEKSLVFPINVDSFDPKFIRKKTKLHEIVLLLRLEGIEYRELPYVLDIGYLTFLTKSGVVITFDLERGVLFRIGKLYNNESLY